MRKRIVNLLLLSALGSLMSCRTAPGDNEVARVGAQAITADEFKARYALTPYFSQFPEDDPETKKLVLASFVGEKVLAGEARKRNLDKTARFAAVSHEMEKEAVIEAVTNDLFSEIDVSDSELWNGLANARRVLTVEELVFDSRAAADSVRPYLDASKSFAASYLVPSEQVARYTVKWGDSEPEIEDVLWRLKPGEISSPLSYAGQFYLLRIAGEVENPLFASGDSRSIEPQIRATIEKRKRRQIYQTFFRKLMAGKRTHVPAEKLKFIAEQLERALQIPTSERADSTLLRPILMTDDQYALANTSLADRLDEPLVTFDDGAVWTIGDFIRNLRFGPYPLNYSSKAAFRASLRNMAIMMMEQEYVAKAGYRQGLDKSSYVLEEKQMWTDSFLADQMRLQVVRAKAEPILANGHASFTANENPKAARVAALDHFLARVLPDYEIIVNHVLLDTLRLRHTKMVVFKRHFPGRQAEPTVLPLDNLPNFMGAVVEAISK